MADRVREACEACFDAHKGDCSAFARAVGSTVGVPPQGLADENVQTLRGGPGITAAEGAHDGKLVMAGVVVVVDGPLDDNAHPSAYWGELGGPGAKDKTINWAWRAEDRDRVTYAEHDI